MLLRPLVLSLLLASGAGCHSPEREQADAPSPRPDAALVEDPSPEVLPEPRLYDALRDAERPHRMTESEFDSLWAELTAPPYGASTHWIDTLDVNGDGRHDALFTPGCGSALCPYDTFVRDGSDVVYVGGLETGPNGPRVCQNERGETVVAMTWGRLYGGGAILYRITPDGIETVAQTDLDPDDGFRLPPGFFPAGCDA